MGLALIATCIAVAAEGVKMANPEPPCGGVASAFARCAIEKTEPPAPSEERTTRRWRGIDLGATIAGASTVEARPGAYATCHSFSILGIHWSLVLVGGFGFVPLSNDTAVAEARTDVDTLDFVVFERAGSPDGTPFDAKIELYAAGGVRREIRAATPHDDGRVLLRSVVSSNMIGSDAVIEITDETVGGFRSPVILSRRVTLRTGVEYRIARSSHASVSPVRIGIDELATIGGIFLSRMRIRPLADGVTFTSCAQSDYQPCPSDLDWSRVVDDADFAIFAAAHDLANCADPAMPVDCPADLNLDGVVDSEDFVQLLAGYDEMICPYIEPVFHEPQ